MWSQIWLEKEGAFLSHWPFKKQQARMWCCFLLGLLMTEPILRMRNSTGKAYVLSLCKVAALDLTQRLEIFHLYSRFCWDCLGLVLLLLLLFGLHLIPGVSFPGTTIFREWSFWVLTFMRLPSWRTESESFLQIVLWNLKIHQSILLQSWKVHYFVPLLPNLTNANTPGGIFRNSV